MVYIEACESGSMFEKQPAVMNIDSATATGPDEHVPGEHKWAVDLVILSLRVSGYSVQCGVRRKLLMSFVREGSC